MRHFRKNGAKTDDIPFVRYSLVARTTYLPLFSSVQFSPCNLVGTAKITVIFQCQERKYTYILINPPERQIVLYFFKLCFICFLKLKKSNIKK